MGRNWRQEYTGGIYHVISRGNNREHIFRESMDKGYFVKLLKESGPAMAYDIHAYVLMGNHYHILMQTKGEKLQKIMHQINNKYSKYFNGKYKRVGHVFQGRYKAASVQDERYLLKLVRYIHQNPVRAGICGKAENYRWSSDICYRKGIKGFVKTELILLMLDKDKTEATAKYKAFMEEEEITQYSKLNAIGNEAYQILCESRKQVKERKRLDEILIETGITLEDLKMIKSGSRKRMLTKYKLQYAREAAKQHYTMNEIGGHIGVTGAAVKDMLDRYA